MKNLTLIAYNLRSAHNVGSLIRTAEGLGLTEIYLCGYTPYPKQVNDKRLPHLSVSIDQKIKKTSLGAEDNIKVYYEEDVIGVIDKLKAAGFAIVALEQSANSVPIYSFKVPTKTAVIIGNEVDGLDERVIKLTDTVVEIPMKGKKESFNVVQATAMMLFYCSN